MTDDRATDAHNGEMEPLSAIFQQMGFDHVKAVASCALEFRGKASESVRSALASAISRSIRLDGFKDASKAQPQQLVEPVMWAIFGERDDRLAGAVLRAWAESQGPLHDLVVEHLEGVGISAVYPDFRENRFVSTWSRAEWLGECEAFVEKHEDLDEDDVALMLCYASGKSPEPPYEDGIESPLLLEWLRELREIPPDAPDWNDVRAFVSSVIETAAEKALALISVQVDALEEAVTAIAQDFGDELQYLELDISSWFDDAMKRPLVIPEALEVVTGLKDMLAEYRRVRPQASSRSEEEGRAEERREREAAVLDIADKWGQMIESAESLEDNLLLAAEETGDSEASTLETNAEAGGAEENQTASIQEYESLRAELEQTRRDSDSLRLENARLSQENSGLLSDRTLLNEENSKLRGDLSERRESEESWRRAYVSARASQANDETDEPAQPLSVNDAIAQAERAFPDRLVIALNSKSAKNSPFQKPDEVFEALAWLATVYHRLRTNPGASPDFDMLLKETCPGWSYKPGQAEVAKEQFAEWYTTTAGGKTYELYPHIGKGTSADPRNTVRIAFAWDNDLEKVIVGYVGLHQRTRRS